MRVYRFLNEEYALKSIRERQLKISNILELNDPFEFQAVDISDKKFRFAIKSTIEEAAKEIGIICFSSKWSNPVLRSHYADNHRGICLGFDIPKCSLKEMIYSSKKNKILPEKIVKVNFFNTSIVVDLFDQITQSKYDHWKYESEFRTFNSLYEKTS